MGCSKTDLSRWHKKPYSFNATSNNAKFKVIRNAQKVFLLTDGETEYLANTAGLSLSLRYNAIVELLKNYKEQYSRLCNQIGITDRMLRYYINGIAPTKYILLALGIILKLAYSELIALLNAYGYCLSDSLCVDVIVKYYLFNVKMKNIHDINYVLEKLNLPVLGSQK
ncbi:hypothetical protein [uncultured Cloacibacillus sp.]|uniref:hypothetical protein n=1 Tax=uncultured Cloacibacillus sp. TaxID=889794 RepID=UPI0026DAB244|nr:hypothetical protein [uncultured Cloacibacillus sp.]